jgi:hypothetical protein
MKTALTILLLVFTIGCGKWQGTDTGNPFSNNGQCDGGNTCSAGGNSAQAQALQICNRVVVCHPTISLSACYSAVFAQKGLQLEIDVNKDSFESLAMALTDKTVQVDSEKYKSCEKSLIDLTCESDVLKEAFSGDDLTNYSQIHKILRANTDCRSVYK